MHSERNKSDKKCYTYLFMNTELSLHFFVKIFRHAFNLFFRWAILSDSTLTANYDLSNPKKFDVVWVI